MTKGEIIKAVSATTGASQKVTGEIIDATLIQIQKLLAEGSAAEFFGFGNFKVVDKAETTGRNPQTGETITIPAHKSPRFEASKALKEIVNGKRAVPETKKAPAGAEAE